ncbi:bi-domain-containing oxidoreductase [Idiomarina loihiensis]|uniref:bi-domain-containing oxidoreductase n=1 Tax=Idiomarina loihiensis TaxID=135577 RepID=UPI00385044D2
MKQVLQDLSNGETYLANSPSPSVTPNTLLISTKATLVSVGTERMLIDFGRASYIQKARQQPEKVKMVLGKVKVEGVLSTIDAIRSKLSQPIPLGYSNVGIVQSVGHQVKGFRKGDRVLSNGPHSDIVRVPQNLVAKIPDNVSDGQAAFTVVGAIGLQGIRLAQPTLGEAFVVTGVGLIGLLTVQLLIAHGCRVLAIDFDNNKLELAKKFGAEVCNPSSGDDVLSTASSFSRGQGVDGVLITAATKSSEPVSQAAEMCRKRGRIVLVGVTGLNLNRSDFYEKELSFQVSCSYGPGRYDSKYEVEGQDYPLGFVRWTEQRNFVAILDMISSGKIDVDSLVSHCFDFEEAPKAYNLLASEKNALGILLKYSSAESERLLKTVQLAKSNLSEPTRKASIGFIGAGNYASRVLIPAFKKNNAYLHTISTSGGINGVIHGKKSGFEYATTDTLSLIENTKINTVAIATQHNTHSDFVVDAINAGKHIFVEKPLAINSEQLQKVKTAYEKLQIKPIIMVGFNRRFSPQIKKMKLLLSTIKQPKSFIMTMNAGYIPNDHWTQDNSIGGGRIIGEACHYVDLMRFLAGSEITSVTARRMGDSSGLDESEDKATITLGFADGSFGTIFYLANGSPSFPKERIEVFAESRVLQLDNFRKLRGFGWPGFRKMNLWKQDKGQLNCVSEFLKSIETGDASPITFEEIYEVSSVTIEAAEQMRAQQS